ncbi:hypothetical protein H9L39_01765 [Fusarium oxysporum f. sp. albedinis]|nr:hypothetical protein H9L39_01765 [Fusarium oxysporum f. sp. albedinis]
MTLRFFSPSLRLVQDGLEWVPWNCMTSSRRHRTSSHPNIVHFGADLRATPGYRSAQTISEYMIIFPILHICPTSNLKPSCLST